MQVRFININNINSNPQAKSKNKLGQMPVSSELCQKEPNHAIKSSNLNGYFNINFKGAIKDHIGQGARYMGNGSTKFTLTAPLAENVLVTVYRGDLEKGNAKVIQRAPLEEVENGLFSTVLKDAKPGDKYTYTVMTKNGDMKNVYDPRADYLPYDIEGYKKFSNMSEIVDHSSFEWQDQEWMANRSSSNEGEIGWALPKKMIIESMHIGLLGGFKNAKEEIDKIADAGVADAVRIMPIGEFFGEKNWGYDEVAKFAVENSYGRPEDLKDLVNHAHKKGKKVILDVVPNHFGPYGSVVQDLMPTFASGKKTPWGNMLEFNGENGKYMRSYMNDMLVNWAVNYHVDGFRFDATHFMDSTVAIQEIISDLRSHPETKDLILYPEDMRISRTMANSNLKKEVSDENWGFSALTTFDFYKSMIANITKVEKHGVQPDLHQLEHIFKNTIIKSHEESIADDPFASHEYKDKCRNNMRLPKANADNMLVNISNHDEIGNEAGGKRNLVNILDSRINMTDRCDGNWRTAQWLLFEMIKEFSKTGECFSEEKQKEMGCKHPVPIHQFGREFKNSFEFNKMLIGSMFMHPSPKEFFMGDDRGELAPLKFFCETPKTAINPDTNKPYLWEIADEKGYLPDEKAFNESKLGQAEYNPSWVAGGTQAFSRDFAKLYKELPVFETCELDKVETFSHKDRGILEVKRYDAFGHEVIALMNFSPYGITDLDVKTTSKKPLKELINSNDQKYNSDGNYSNKGTVNSDKVSVPPFGIVLLEPS